MWARGPPSSLRVTVQSPANRLSMDAFSAMSVGYCCVDQSPGLMNGWMVGCLPVKIHDDRVFLDYVLIESLWLVVLGG